MPESMEEYLGRMEAEGYINSRGAPLKCLFCESKEFEEKEYYEEYCVVEKEVFCKNCGKEVGRWSYGSWEV